MQDLGAAGMTSSVVECAARGGVGSEIDVALVPRRETGMNAYEIMLSESQERMLLVVRPQGVDRVNEIVHRWSLNSSVIGTITDDGMVRIKDGDLVVAEVPAHLYTDECPTYIRPKAESAKVIAARSADLGDVSDIEESEIGEILLQLLGSPNICSRRPVFQRYDHTILTNTVVGPGEGDAAVIRVKGTDLAVVISIDCNPRYCYLDPRLGAAHAVAEAARNVVCSGGKPLAITNCLNFGNPQKPEGYFQLSEAVGGMGDACRVLGIPVVSGNVSLYNESADGAVFPTPTVGAVGLIENFDRCATISWRAGDIVALIDGATPQIGGSEYLSTIKGRTEGSPPPLNLDREKSVQDIVQEAIADGTIRTAHDCSEGGLLVALAEMAIASGVGIHFDEGRPESVGRLDARWFGEAPSRIIVSGDATSIESISGRCTVAGVPFIAIGTAGGDAIIVGESVRLSVAEATRKFERGLFDLS